MKTPKVHNTYPLSPIPHRTRIQRTHQPPIHILTVDSIQDGLQKIIRLFHFIPKKQICLRQFKSRNIILLLNGHTKDICGSKNPTTSTTALIRHGGSLKGDFDVEILRIADQSCWFFENGCGVVRGEGGEAEAVFGVLENVEDVGLCVGGVDVGDVEGGGGKDVSCCYC